MLRPAIAKGQPSTWKLSQHGQRRSAEDDGLSSRLAVRQEQRAAFEIDVVPFLSGCR